MDLGQRTMNDFAPFLSALLSTMTDTREFTSHPPLAEVFEKYPHLVVACNHATPLSWMPAIAMLAKECVKAGGGGRIPRGVVDRFFYRVPGLRSLGQWISQSPTPMRMDQWIDAFQGDAASDLIVFPEGSHSFVEDVDSIQNFRSSRFVEFAVQTGVPVLIAVHRGSESWAHEQALPSFLRKGLQLAPSSFVRKIGSEGRFNIPIPTRQIPSFRMHCELWTEHLKFRRLPFEGVDAKAKVREEADRIRRRMIDIHDSLGFAAGENP